MVKIVASTSMGPEGSGVTRHKPDLVELRLDLVKGDSAAIAREWRDETDIPLVLTLRSRQEGGQFPGPRDDWWKIIGPLLPYASYVDIERDFSLFAPRVKKTGALVIGSYHTGSMPSMDELVRIAQELRAFGDIPKVVVSPANYDEVILFLSFTFHTEKPVITSIMGEQFHHIRTVLPFFGSAWIFGHAGTPTSAGQYHVKDLKSLFTILND